MGFLTSIGKMFGSADTQRRTKQSGANGHRAQTPAMAGAGAGAGGAGGGDEGGAVGVLDQATTLRERAKQAETKKATDPSRHQRAESSGAEAESDAPLVVEPEAREDSRDLSPPPRNKQELFEELQRNYRDVVDLVKKVDAHLDRNEQRSREMMAIAQRIDKTLPAIEKFPDQVREQLEGLKTEVVGAIEASSAKGDARGAQIQQTLSTIGERIDTTSASHTQLVSTMAGFRETLGELAQHSSRTSEVLETIDTRRAQREDELTKMLIASRRWSVTTLAVTLLGVSVAVAIAIVALVMRA